jgi:hypothetical protein
MVAGAATKITTAKSAKTGTTTLKQYDCNE